MPVSLFANGVDRRGRHALPAESDAAAAAALVVELQRRALGDERFDSVEA